MNQLSLFSTVSYAELQLLCLCILMLLLGLSINNDRNTHVSSSFLLHGVFVSYSLVLLFDAIGVIAEYNNMNFHPVIYFANIMWFVGIITATGFWFMYIQEQLNTFLFRKRVYSFIMMLPLVAAAVFSVLSPVNELVFYVDEETGYERGPLYMMVISIICFYHFMIIIQGLICSRITKIVSGQQKEYWVSLASVPVTVFLLLQVYTECGFAGVGYTLSLIFVYVFHIGGAKQHQMELVNTLVDDYEAAFIVNADKDEIFTIRLKDSYTEVVNRMESTSSYRERILDGIEKNIVNADKEMVAREFSAENVVARLQDEPSFSVSYRIKSEQGREMYFRAKFARMRTKGENIFILGIRNEDRTIRESKQIEDVVAGMAVDFDALLFVDFEEDYKAVTYRIRPEFTKYAPLWNDSTDYPEKFNRYVNKFIYTEDREAFKEALNLKKIREELSKHQAYYYSFRLKMGKKAVYYQLKITAKYTDERIRGLIVGMRNIDKETRERLEEAHYSNVRNDLIKILSDDYSGLFYFDMSDNRKQVIELSVDEKGVTGKGISHSLPKPDDYYHYIEKYVHPDDKKLFEDLMDPDSLRKVLANKKRHSVVYRKLAPEGYKYNEIVFAKAEDENEKPMNIAIGFAEIDAQYMAQQAKEIQLKEALAVADTANNAKSSFLFNISHDIRTPMNAIIGFTDLARKHLGETEKVGEYLEKIDMSGQHLLKLINEVLDMARIESGKIKSEIQPVHILGAINSILAIGMENADENGIEFEFISKGVRDRALFVDVLHLNQILMNILSNAVKYTPKGGKVTFTLKEQKSTVKEFAKYQFIVSDTGCGMSKEFLSHIYESFAREKSATDAGVEGTGLGMAIVKKLVDFMDGNIDIKSAPGVGTTVSVSLSFRLQTKYNIGVEKFEDEQFSLSGRKALVVEDNDLNREIIAEILKEEGMIADEATNGEEAYKKILQKGVRFYDYILMDIQMPVMNGYETTGKIRRLQGGDKVPIIALSANAFEEDKQKSIDAGMNAHVAKPINLKELLRTLQTFSGRD